ncbi:MAG: hypothetical protein ACI9KN_002493 [Gammaproteobacteria bacterium]|jgi:hypothetical protein
MLDNCGQYRHRFFNPGLKSNYEVDTNTCDRYFEWEDKDYPAFLV